MIRVLLVEEAGLLRGALVAILSSEPDIEVVAEVGSPSECSRITLFSPPDVVVVGLDTTRRESSGLVQALRVRFPDSALIVLAAKPTPYALRRALAADVRGFLSKDLAPRDLVQMLREIHAGQRVIDPAAALSTLIAATNPLTGREREILRATAEGLVAKQIAERLCLTPGTVRNHVSAILRKTGCRDRWEAVQRARDAGWL